MILKSVQCDPACGFMVRSHSAREVVDVVLKHAKRAHRMNLTASDVRGMMKTVRMKARKR